MWPSAGLTSLTSNHRLYAETHQFVLYRFYVLELFAVIF